jgi:anti-sigma factor RsiW
VTCEDARPLVNAYVDRELDVVKSLEIEAHLNGCAACAREEASLRALHSMFGNSYSSLYHEAPARLERQVRVALREARRTESRRGFALRRYSWVGAAAAAVLFLAIIVKDVLPPGSSAGEATAREVVNEHLRSLTGNHLTDVLSSNQHTVKPWFDGRLNFTPPVKDLGPEGFPLVGGRLDYLDNRPVAALVYRRRQHIINLFIAPAEHAGDARPTGQVRAGYNIVHWTKSGMTYWAVSSLSAAELAKFAQLVSEESSPAPTPVA